MLRLKLLLGFFRCCRGNLGRTASGQMLFPQKDVPGKRFSSNSWKAIYSLGRKLETLNLAVGGEKKKKAFFRKVPGKRT